MFDLLERKTLQRFIDREEAFMEIFFSYDLAHVEVGFLDENLGHIADKAFGVLDILEYFYDNGVIRNCPFVEIPLEEY